MHLADDIGASDAEILVAALKACATEVIWPKIEILDEGAKSAIKYDDAFVDCRKIRLARHWS
jgi:hypothetical protein